MTTAERISRKLNDDGQRFVTEDGTRLDTLCMRENGRQDWEHGRGTDPERWTFRDGSVITVAGDGWDLGYPDCYCWQGAGHTEECMGDRWLRSMES